MNPEEIKQDEYQNALSELRNSEAYADFVANERKWFEKFHCGGINTIRDSTITTRYVYASIDDAWQGWLSRAEFECIYEQLKKEKENG